MSSLLKISEAANLAIHTMFLLAKNQDKLTSTKEIATILNVSENHLSKVLQRLVKVGYVESIRGPKGGFKINVDDTITMLEIYEAIDGSIISCKCLLSSPICGEGNCILDGFLNEVNTKFKETLSSKRLSDLCKNNK